MSDSNDFTIIGLSKVNSSIVGPDVFPTKSFSFVISVIFFCHLAFLAR